MIVCVCHKVNDKALETVINGGANTLRDVSDACGAGTDCGQCCREILDALRKRTRIWPATHDAAPLSK